MWKWRGDNLLYIPGMGQVKQNGMFTMTSEQLARSGVQQLILEGLIAKQEENKNKTKRKKK